LSLPHEPLTEQSEGKNLAMQARLPIQPRERGGPDKAVAVVRVHTCVLVRKVVASLESLGSVNRRGTGKRHARSTAAPSCHTGTARFKCPWPCELPPSWLPRTRPAGDTRDVFATERPARRHTCVSPALSKAATAGALSSASTAAVRCSYRCQGAVSVSRRGAGQDREGPLREARAGSY